MTQNAIESDIHLSRLQNVRENFGEWGVNAILIESPANRFWLSGFSGSAGWLLVNNEKAILGTDSRYWVQVISQSPNFKLMRFQGDPEAYMAEFLAEAGDGAIGIESQHLTLKQLKQLEKSAGFEWIQLDGAVESLRKTKSEDEIKIIERAAAITDKAMAMVSDLARPGMTERELAWKLERIMRESGASGISFPVIVASGPNAARPHHNPGDRQLTIGDSIIIDMGAKVDRYCSDLTRTFYLGESLSDRFSEVYNTVLDAQENALKNMKSGMNGAEIDLLARQTIDAAGYGEEFGHALGHGVGIEIHESPNLSSRASEEGLPAGSVVTVEPGIYIENWGGVRIEDLVLLKDDGNQVLSQCPKSPTIPVRY